MLRLLRLLRFCVLRFCVLRVLRLRRVISIIMRHFYYTGGLKNVVLG